MDLLIAFFVFIGGAVLLMVILAKLHPGDGSDLLDFHPGKRLAQRYEAEFDDMDEMLAAHNRRRGERGLPPQTEDEYREQMQREERGWDA